MTFKLYDSMIRMVKGVLPEAVPSGHRALRAHDDGWYDHDAGDATGILLATQDGVHFDNLIHNSNLDIWNEGTSFVSPATGAYLAEGWVAIYATSATVTITRDTDVPTPSAGHSGAAKSNYSLKVDVTGADASIAAGDNFHIRQNLEGYVFNAVAQRKMVVSMWFKASKAGTYCMVVLSGSADRSWVKEFVVSANTWTKLEMPIDPSPTGGTWDYTNGVGLLVALTLMAGSSLQTTQNAWQTGTYLATANQTNGMDDVANNFWICQPKLEIGDKATIFVPEPIQVAKLRCNRYFYKSYPFGTNPGTASTLGQIVAEAASTGALAVAFKFPTEMRTPPTVVIYPNDGSPTATVSTFLTGTDVGAAASAQVSSMGIATITDSGAPYTDDVWYMFHITANARL